jgi:hypothetical protein
MEYRAAGLEYNPPASPLESIDELGSVRGMSSRLLDRLRPHLSLFSAIHPDPASADPLVAIAIAFADRGTAIAPGASVRPADANGIVTVRIFARARGPGNAEVTRTAIVRIGTFNAIGYSLLSWEHEIE